MSEEVVVIPEVQKLREYLQVRRDAAVQDLQTIQTITTDEQYAAAEEVLTQAKQLYDKMSAKRKSFTDPIKKAIEEIMTYENSINYTSKSENEYNRARAILEEYNQKKIDAKKQAEHEAWLRAEQMKYKAEYKAKVNEQLLGKINGLVKNVIQQMSDWEAKLKLESFDQSVEKLRASQPSLKREYFDECFYRWGNRPDIMVPKQEDEYLTELKKELTFETYNEKYQQLVAPIKNEYLAKVEQIKKRLQEMAAADDKKKADMLAKQEADRQARVQEEIASANKRHTEEMKTVQDQKDVDMVEADFTQQAMTADIDAGPSKKVASFTNDAMWLTPFLKVVGKVAVHPKFKGILGKDAYVPEVQKWLDFYAANVGEGIEGITFAEKAKTIVKKR